MKKQLEMQIDTYTFGVAVESGNKAYVYFDKNTNENESIRIPFINGFPEAKFIVKQFGEIGHWYKANDKWKGKQIKIAMVDEKPMALISIDNEEICLLTSPIFTKGVPFFLSDGNLLYLKEEYGVSRKEFYQKIQEEFLKGKGKVKVYEKERKN